MNKNIVSMCALLSVAFLSDMCLAMGGPGRLATVAASRRAVRGKGVPAKEDVFVQQPGALVSQKSAGKGVGILESQASPDAIKKMADAEREMMRITAKAQIDLQTPYLNPDLLRNRFFRGFLKHYFGLKPLEYLDQLEVQQFKNGIAKDIEIGNFSGMLAKLPLIESYVKKGYITVAELDRMCLEGSSLQKILDYKMFNVYLPTAGTALTSAIGLIKSTPELEEFVSQSMAFAAPVIPLYGLALANGGLVYRHFVQNIQATNDLLASAVSAWKKLSLPEKPAFKSLEAEKEFEVYEAAQKRRALEERVASEEEAEILPEYTQAFTQRKFD